MPFVCFACGRTPRESCMTIAGIYMIFSIYHVLWAIYYLTSSSHWVYYLTLVVNLVSLPFHAVLFLGAKKERRDYIYPWIVFSLVVTFPFCILLLAVCIFHVQFMCIIIDLLALLLRVYMWLQVRKYHAQLLTSTTSMEPKNTGRDQPAPGLV